MEGWKTSRSKTIALDAINARPLIPYYRIPRLFLGKRGADRRESDSFDARVSEFVRESFAAISISPDGDPPLLCNSKKLVCFNFDRSSRCPVSLSPPLSSGQSTTDCTRLHKLKFLRSHRGAEKSTKWNAIRRREGTILARVQKWRNRDEKKDDDSLRFGNCENCELFFF